MTSPVVAMALSTLALASTDGRFSGGTTGLCIGHVTPESFDHGPISICENGDVITLNLTKRELNLEISESEVVSRLEDYVLPEPRYKSGVLNKYSKLVSGADTGAVTS